MTRIISHGAGRRLRSPLGLAVSLTLAVALAGIGFLLASAGGPAARPTTGVVSAGDTAFHGGQSAAASSSSGGCAPAQLSVRLGPPSGAAGHEGQTVGFVNTSAASCTLYGYPGMLMLDSSGRAMPTEVVRGAGSGPTEVTLAPGGEASFVAYWADGIGYGNEQCPTSTRVEITPPNAYEQITVPWSIAPYGGPAGGPPCGYILVSPVRAG